jgi:hypothetical protein
MRNMKRRSTAILLICLSAGCSAPPPRESAGPMMLPAADIPGAYDAVLRSIPVGTSIGKAVATLEQQGFRCQSDSLHIYGERRQPLRPNIARQWQVTLLHDGAVITHVAVSATLAVEPQVREGSQLPGRR